MLTRLTRWWPLAAATPVVEEDPQVRALPHAPDTLVSADLCLFFFLFFFFSPVFVFASVCCFRVQLRPLEAQLVDLWSL